MKSLILSEYAGAYMSSADIAYVMRDEKAYIM